MPRTLMWLVVCLLGLSGCVRFGYTERWIPAADGGSMQLPDAGASDVDSQPDASPEPDAAVSAPDASAKPDASPEPDAAVSAPDASAKPDASPEPDAAVSAPDSGSNCRPSAARDYCMQLPALAQPPQLDGMLDCGLALIDLPATSWNSVQPLPSDNHARYAAAWRPNGLYFYVEVDDMLRLPALASDVNPWCGDGVELYVDADGTYVSAPNYDYPGANQLLAAAPARDSSTPLAVDARYHTRSQQRVGDWSATRHVMVPRDNGYALEAFVAAADLDLSSWQLASGGKVGLDIAINVSVVDENQTVGCGYELGQYYLRVSRSPCDTDACRPYSNAAAFCTAVLE